MLKQTLRDPRILPALTGEKKILYVNSGNCKVITDERIQTIEKIKRSG